MPPAGQNLFAKRFRHLQKLFTRESFSLFSSCPSWFTKTGGESRAPKGLTFSPFFVMNLIMETKEYAQQIVDELLYLPKEKIIEVADFVHFLREKVQHGKSTLYEAGLTRAEALDLRRRLSTFENDWDIPGMDAYDNL